MTSCGRAGCPIEDYMSADKLDCCGICYENPCICLGDKNLCKDEVECHKLRAQLAFARETLEHYSTLPYYSNTVSDSAIQNPAKQALTRMGVKPLEVIEGKGWTNGGPLMGVHIGPADECDWVERVTVIHWPKEGQ